MVSARRMWPLLVVVVVAIWSPGAYEAYRTYVTTFESAATIWVERANSQLSGSPNDPNLLLRNSPASEQTELFNQLLQTDSFLADVVEQTARREALTRAADKQKFLAEVRKRFRTQVLGTNLLKISYRADEPGTAAEMVRVALDERDARVKKSRSAVMTASITWYQKQSELAQAQAQATQRALDAFNASHGDRALSATEEYERNRLRLAVDVAQGHLADIRQQIERGSVATALQDLTEQLAFQVIDVPSPSPFPSGGTRDASLVAGVAGVAGLLLAAFIVVAKTLIDDRIDGLADVAHTERELLGMVPNVKRKVLQASLTSALRGPMSVQPTTKTA